jgi:serine/threonine protein kinase
MAHLIELPGGEGPVNDGERRVIAALLEQLPGDYLLIPNIEMGERDGQRFEYDLVIIAPHSVYAIEVKDWRGDISGDDREWLLNGVSRRAPLSAISRKAKILKSKLIAHQQALARVWVEGAVVLARDPASLILTPEARHRTFLLREVVGFLQDPSGARQRAAAIADLIPSVTQALGAQARPRRQPLIFGAYEALELLDQSEDEALYRGRHRQMGAAPEVRLRVVTLSPYVLTDQQRSERKAQLFRELESLLQMGSHPNVIAAREVFEDEGGRMILVLDATEGRSLRQRLQNGTPLTVEERLDLLIGVCAGLAHAHSHGVIHRRVEPENVLLDDHGAARLSRFGLAKLLTPEAVTVWSDEALRSMDIRYLAPELQNPTLGTPSHGTDLYGLGCLAFELFAGNPPFEEPSQAFAGCPSIPEIAPSELAELIPKLLQGDPRLRPADTKDVLSALETIRGSGRSRPLVGPKPAYVPGDVIDGKFEVRDELGKGGFSCVYRVYRAIDDCEYALKVFNVGDAYEKVQREANVLRNIQHPHVVRVVWADRTQAGQWYLVSELVQGESLDDYVSGSKRLSAQEAVDVALELLSALEAIHPDQRRIEDLERAEELSAEEYEELQELKNRGIVHRDIKPQNLILTTSGIVLIDFNIASRVGDQVVTLSGTPRYQAPDVELTTWDVSTDLFAVGVVLYELLCGVHPYEDAQPRADHLPRDPRQFRLDLSAELAEFLVRACSPFRADRFQNAVEMRAVLEELDPLLTPLRIDRADVLPTRLSDLLAHHPPNVNPMVREFLALASQARRSNRATRGLDDLAEATYVQTRLDMELTESLLTGRHQLVIVTGNAGDGKTAFIQQTEGLAKQKGAMIVEAGPNGSRLSYADQMIHTLYDGSQDEEDRTSDEVLREFFAPFAPGVVLDGESRIAAINEGRLRDFILSYRESFPVLLLVLEQLDQPDSYHDDADGAVVVINLNHRSVTAGGDDSIFARQLRLIANGPFWGPCQTCDYRTRCPIKHNVDTFKDGTSGPATAERLRRLVDLVRLRRRRHLTMRDVRSLISFLLFRDRTCEEIPDLLSSESPLDIVNVAYFQAAAGLGVPAGSALDRGAELLSEIDVALVANPIDDRGLALARGPRRMSFPTRESDYSAELIARAQELAGVGYDSDPMAARQAHQAIRRLAYFERSDEGWWEMLPYKQLRTLEDALDPANTDVRDALRQEVIGALSMAEGMADSVLAFSALWVATSAENDSSMRCFRRFPLESFVLEIVKSEVPYVESESDRLELVHTPSEAFLSLDLDLLEVLERLRDGYVPSLEEGRGLLINLSLFKNRLLAEPSTELVISIDDELMRIAAGASGRVALMEDLS